MRHFYLDEQVIDVPILFLFLCTGEIPLNSNIFIFNLGPTQNYKHILQVWKSMKKSSSHELANMRMLEYSIQFNKQNLQLPNLPTMPRSSGISSKLTHPQRLHFVFLLYIILLMQCANNQLLITLSRPQSSSVAPIAIYNSTATPALNRTFVYFPTGFNCSLSPLYTYSQSHDEYKNNTPYFLTLNNTSTAPQDINVSISAQYNSINPQLNGSQSVTCTTYPCELQIVNNCHLPTLTYFDYFDVVRLNISSLDNAIISYYVLCNVEFEGNTFQFGLFIQIFLCTILITVVALYSNAWSIGGAGWPINLPIVLFFNALLIIGGIVAIFAFNVVAVAVNVLSWVFGIAAVWLCTNQLLFLVKCTDLLRKEMLQIKSLGVRALDLFSLVISIGVCVGWWLSSKNWIMNDIIAVSMIIAAIKVLKFTSLKQALICFGITISVEMIFVLVLTFKIKASYNTAILNIFNNPFQLQLPTINHVYNQKCAWLPVTALIYPGALMSYMRRFDSSRNTRVYIITCVCVFLLGSLVWLVISIVSKDSWPFGLIAEPAALSLISFFAWKRKEIRTIWTGKFYDEQFVNKEGLKTIGQSIERERDKTQIVYSPDLFSGLHMKDEQSSMEYPDHIIHPISQEPKPKQEEPKAGLDQSLISDKSSETSTFRKIQLSQIVAQKYKAEEQKTKNQREDPNDSTQRNRMKSKFPQAIQRGAM